MFTDTIKQGADYFLIVEDKNPDGTATDLTGCTAHLQGRRNVEAGEILVDLTSGIDGGLTITPLIGRILIHITAAKTKLLAGTIVFALELYFPGGVEDRPLDGMWVVDPEKVRP